MLDISTEFLIPQAGIHMNIPEMRVAAVTGTADPVTGNGDLIAMSSFRGKSRQISVVGVSDEQNYDSELSSGVANTYPTVNVSGGSGNYTYAWTFTSNIGNALITLANTKNPRVYKSYGLGANGIYSATLQCVVTDTSNSSTATATGITAISEWANGLQ